MGWKVERKIGRHVLSIETGNLAKQANGAALVKYADTVILSTATDGPKPAHLDFFPLTVDYREKTSAAGKFPGGFIKREGRPTTKETLTMRLIDRPLRPLFPENYEADLAITAMVLSADKQNDPDVLSVIGSAAALVVSDIPFIEAVGAVRVGRVNGELILMPTHDELETSELDLVVAGTKDAVMMVEAGAKEVPESVMVEAIEFAHAAVREIVAMLNDLRAQCGKVKQDLPAASGNGELRRVVEQTCRAKLDELNFVEGKKNREKAIAELKKSLLEKLGVEGPDPKYTPAQVAKAFGDVERAVVRKFILSGKRPDGRSVHEIRPISIEVGVLPRTHGSTIFTRGETQALVVATLGTVSDEQRVEGLVDEYTQRFMVHYNFPSFSVGEVKPNRGPSRRDIGHGALAERALEPVIPGAEEFPYTIRIISDILESNGSSSMATVCGATLCLMDAGVPIKFPVAGIAMGLVQEPQGEVILSDIQGAEDHYGDMDFKVAGTARGITALQMDVKVGGIRRELMSKALEQARAGRVEILRKMLAVIQRPRAEISSFAPRLVKIKVAVDKIGTVIGPGGKMVRSIQETTGCQIDIEDDGTITISGPDDAAVSKARAHVEGLTATPEIGRTYTGKVVSVKDFGAFVEILPGTDGLLHVSELSNEYVRNVADVVKEGDMVTVKVLSVDDQGRIKLSRKALLTGDPGSSPIQSGSGSSAPRRDRGDRGGRGGDRGGRPDRGDRGGNRGGDRGPKPGGEPSGEPGAPPTA